MAIRMRDIVEKDPLGRRKSAVSQVSVAFGGKRKKKGKN